MAKATAGMKHKKCGVVGCAEQHKFLHLLPNLGEVRVRWLEIPNNVDKCIFVCTNNFVTDTFNNLAQYNAQLVSLSFSEKWLSTLPSGFHARNRMRSGQ